MNFEKVAPSKIKMFMKITIVIRDNLNNHSLYHSVSTFFEYEPRKGLTLFKFQITTK